MAENKSSESGSQNTAGKKKSAKKKVTKSVAAKKVENEAENAVAAEAPSVEIQSEPVQSNSTPDKSRSSTGTVSWLALILSLTALGGTGYTWYLTAVDSKLSQGQQANNFSLLDQRVNGFERLQNDLGSQISQLRTQISQSETDVSERLRKIRGEMDSQEQLVNDKMASAESMLSDQTDAFRSEFDALSESVVNLRSELGRSLDSWVLEEVQQLISIADYQVRFAGDPDLAKQALRIADSRLEEMADPELLAMRSQLAKDIALLDESDSGSVVNVLHALSALSESIYDLPLSGDINIPEARDASAGQDSVDASNNDGSTDQLTGLNKLMHMVGDALANLISSLANLVQVEKNGKSIKPILSDHERQLTYERTRLFLEAAQIAFVRKDADLYGNRVDQARQWVGERFDPEATATIEWLGDLDALQSSAVFKATPDISESVKLIQDALNRDN